MNTIKGTLGALLCLFAAMMAPMQAHAGITFPDTLGSVNRSMVPAALVKIAVPASFAARWTPPFNLYRSTRGVYSTDFDSSTMLPTSSDITVCVNPQAGSDANTGSCGTDGTDAAPGTSGNGYSPFKNLYKALQQTASGKVTRIWIDASANYVWRGNNAAGYGGSANSNFGWASTVPAGSVYVKNRTPQYRLISASTASTGSPAWTLVSGTLYSNGISATSVGSIVDVSSPMAPVHPTGGTIPPVRSPFRAYLKVADQATCASTPGSWYYDTTGGILYVNTIDGRPADGNIIIGNRANNGRAANAVAGLVTYIDGIDFVGGASAFKAQTLDSATPITVIDRNATYSGSDFSSSSNAFAMIGPVTRYGYRDSFYGAWADNNNAHSNSADGSIAPSPYVFMDQSVSFGAGITGDTASQQDNTSTLHDAAAWLSLNTIDYGSRGIPFAGGTNYAMWMNVGGAIGAPTTTGNALGFLAACSTQNACWLDGTQFGLSTTSQLTIGGTATIGYRNMAQPSTAVDGGTTPVIAPY